MQNDPEILFNSPTLTGKELGLMEEAIAEASFPVTAISLVFVRTDLSNS